MTNRGLLLVCSALAALWVLGCENAVEKTANTSSSSGTTGSCYHEGEWMAVGDCQCAGPGCCRLCCCEAQDTVTCSDSCSDSCSYQGNTYQDGDTFPAGDACNECTCNAGYVSCTEMDCVTCELDGTYFAIGETFPLDSCNTCACLDLGATQGVVTCAPDGCSAICSYSTLGFEANQSWSAWDDCSECTCNTGGLSSCSGSSCTCDPNAWDRVYVNDSPTVCETLSYNCQGDAARFSNECGCGCVQNPSCPQSFDCTAGSCDLPALGTVCPYSDIST